MFNNYPSGTLVSISALRRLFSNRHASGRSFSPTRLVLAFVFVFVLLGKGYGQSVTLHTDCAMFNLDGLTLNFAFTTGAGKNGYARFFSSSELLLTHVDGNWVLFYTDYSNSANNDQIFINSNDVGPNPPDAGWIPASVQGFNYCAGKTLTLSGSVGSTCAVIPYNVTGNGGTSCDGTGVAVGLDDSEIGVNYQLKLNGNNVGSPVAGTGSAIGFGLQTVTGTYSVEGTLVADGCTKDMNGSASIIVESSTLTPTVNITASPGTTIPQGASVTFTATPTHGGDTPSYQWKVNGNNVGSNSNTFSSSTLNNGDVVTVEMVSNHPCTSISTAVASDNSITMTITAAPKNALNFDGVDDGVSVPDNNLLDLNTSFTLEAWINVNAYQPASSPQFGISGIITKNRSAGGTGYGLALTDRDNITFMANNGSGGNFELRAAASIPLNTWTHVAATRDGNTVRLYINGVEVTSGTLSFNLFNSAEPFNIGRFGGGTTGS